MNSNDDLTSTLTQELEERAHTMDGSTLHLADVQGRARSIRRRRTATAVAGVAAAVAVIVPVATLATRGGGSPEPAPAVTQSVTPTPSQGHQPPLGVLDVSDLPTGAEPRMEYVAGGNVLHQFDGSTVDIATQQPVTSFGTLTDGTHVWQTADDQGNATIEIEEADGTMHDPLPSSFGLSVTGSHDAAAWVTPQGQVMVLTTGATEPRTLGDPVPAGHGLRMGPFGSDDCVPDFCSVFVNVSGGNTPGQPWEVADYATRPFTDGDMLTVADEGQGVFIGYTELTDFGSCSILWGGGEFQGFDTCKHTLASISPDEPLVLADPAYHDGIGHGLIGMYGIHGKLLWDRHSTAKAQAFYSEAQWEDGDHVLAPVFQDGNWSIVRFAADGSMEYAVPPVAGEDLDNPYVLATGGPAVGD
jgi:hypothetical protein